MPGQWVNGDRRSRLPADWHKRRAACYRDAGGRCQAIEEDTGQRCTATPPLHGTKANPGGHADHEDRTLGEDGPLKWKCARHHGIKSSREGTAALPRERRPERQHPGLA